MTEAKSIWVIVLEVIIALAFLGTIMTVLRISYKLWDNYELSKQNEGIIRNYAEYAAYDNTTIRGQDLVTLIASTQGDPFVVVTDATGSPLCASFDAYTGDYELSGSCFRDALASSAASSLISSGKVTSLVGGDMWDCSRTPLSATQVQEFFLEGNGTSNPGNYQAFETSIVYAGEGMTEIIGIIAVRSN